MGDPVQWWDKFSFIIEIDGFVRAAFTTCSELAIEAANIAYREGGRRHAHNAPGLITFPEITLSRGQTDDDDMYNWFKDTYDAASGTGLDAPAVYREFEIIQLNHKRVPVERFKVYKAYSRRYSAGDWDNNADEMRMGTCVIQPDYWEKLPV